MADNPHASFVENIWLSIFTPGPTPVLLIATNVAFAALQLILGLLLFFTYSIHFVVLSALCAGLWGSINWFAKEVREVQMREEEEKRRKASDGNTGDDADAALRAGHGTGVDQVRAGVRNRRSKGDSSKTAMADEGMGIEGLDSGDDTATEGTYTPGGGPAANDAVVSSSGASIASTEDTTGNGKGVEAIISPSQTSKEKAALAQASAGRDEAPIFNTGAAARLAPAGAARHNKSLADSTGDLSTDSEWEKVDDDR